MNHSKSENTRSTDSFFISSRLIPPLVAMLDESEATKDIASEREKGWEWLQRLITES